MVVLEVYVVLLDSTINAEVVRFCELAAPVVDAEADGVMVPLLPVADAVDDAAPPLGVLPMKPSSVPVVVAALDAVSDEAAVLDDWVAAPEDGRGAVPDDADEAGAVPDDAAVADEEDASVADAEELAVLLLPASVVSSEVDDGLDTTVVVVVASYVESPEVIEAVVRPVVLPSRSTDATTETTSAESEEAAVPCRRCSLEWPASVIAC